ncbi:MAG: MinD/ParA family protein [Syntrophales bacterium]|nr:MinD/ParA family protein [Syntrophales bacterium]
MDQSTSFRNVVDGKGEHKKKRTEIRRKPIRVIAITSGKGGVGKTNITANLAYVLDRLNRKVMILDADMGLANIDIILGLTPKYNLFHLLRGEKTIEEILIRGPGRLMILPASSGIAEMADLSSGYKLALIDELNAMRERPDFLLIDTAAGISGNVTYFNMTAKEIIVVATPEPASLTDAYALMKVMYQNYSRKKFRIIINMVRNVAEAKDVFKRLQKVTDHFLSVHVDFLGYIVVDDNFKEAVKRQKALVEIFPHSPASRCLQEIAEKICTETVEYDDEGLLSFFNEAFVGHEYR